MATILYKYAFDENKKLVCINDLIKNSSSTHTYICPNCGSIMSARIGNGGKSPHFAHRDIRECNAETYIHKLAKLILRKKWYDNSKDFKIQYEQVAYCIKKESCPFFEEEYCKTNELLSFNLKDEYDDCFEEKKIDNFVADLLITSNKHPDKPIMMEIWVNHESSEIKKTSKNKIIEIKIESIDDLINLWEMDIIESSKVRFIGTFIKESKHRKQLKRDGIIHFKLFNSGKVFMPTSSCNRIPRKSKNTLFECLISLFTYNLGVPANIKKIGLNKAKECGAIDRLCSICVFHKYNEYYNTSVCVLYKRYNLPMEPKPVFAVTCPHYKEDTSDSSWGVTDDEEDLKNAKIMVIS